MAETIDVNEPELAAQTMADRFSTLADEALVHARELVRAELSLVKVELQAEARRAALAGLFVVLALVLLHAGFLVLVASVILALFSEPAAAAVVGLVLLCLAVGAGLAAVAAFKRRHLPRTREGLSRDAHALMRFGHE
jgi:uncharacterized membrane protein YqjE